LEIASLFDGWTICGHISFLKKNVLLSSIFLWNDIKTGWNASVQVP